MDQQKNKTKEKARNDLEQLSLCTLGSAEELQNEHIRIITKRKE